ncbi:MAG: bifunctional (p)ppGpp synthetase/guanosine-3',5'-bis(diphosphate) 3'-pyrophosphohydrolase, partial [Gemmatimonadales bacterium]|nr:bifunctional (p)ppGpp synthetase/guanosine-3',5'-bis(diphosphate) 3'-pyrophosphohydrolase [Gemmatimonadales bacterium]
LRRRRLAMPHDDVVQAAAQRLSLSSADTLYSVLGRGDVPFGQVLKAIFPDQVTAELQAPKPTPFGKVLNRIRLGRGVKIHGVDGLMVRYAQCCQPVPGDPVVGFVTKGRGISIHRADCPNLLTMSNDPERRVEIDWREVEGEVFVVSLGVTGEDRRGLYADLMEAISDSGTNIKSAELSSKDGAMFGSVLVEVENHAHLAKVMRTMRRVKGVQGVERREPTKTT